MSLCRFFPTPSDRMSIIWTLMPIGNAVVLEYGPAGTTHFGGGLYSSLGLELGRSLFTTHISEDDVIMGDVTRLEQAILEIDEAYQPEIIFVVAAAVIAVIGTDIAGVCHYMQEKVSARLISFEEGGFRGDYTYGLRSVYRMLAREVVTRGVKTEKTYNILGASAGAYRVRSDVWEIQNLMREAFGYECNCVLGLECDVKDIGQIGGCSLNLVIRNEALEAGKIIEEAYGVPFYYGTPYGYKGTLEWLEQVAELLGEEINPVLTERLQKKIFRLSPMGGPMGMGMMGIEKEKASVQGDYDTLLGFKRALEEMDLEVEHLICSHSLKAISNCTPQICTITKEKERIALLKEIKGQWCLGSDEMLTLCGDENYVTVVSAPFTSRIQKATHLPFMGEKGMDYLLELKKDFFDRLGY